MHIDESQPVSRPLPNGGGDHPDIKLPPPAWAKAAGAPGGVPPMFAGSGRQPLLARSEIAGTESV